MQDFTNSFVSPRWLRCLVLHAVATLATVILSLGLAVPANAQPQSAAQSESAAASLEQEQTAASKAKYCSDKGKGLVRIPVSDNFQKDNGDICEPTGETTQARISVCLVRGMEAVLVPDRGGVVCAMPSRGGLYLKAEEEKRARDPKRANEQRYFPPERIDAAKICRDSKTQIPDRRILQRGLVKDLARDLKETIDPRGVRIIGGVFCNGVDLNGLDIPYALVLDRSVFLCSGSTECRRSPIEVRNFRTEGDFSIDNAVAYEKVLITRSEISGSLYSDAALLKHLIISDSNVKGSIHFGNAFVSDRLSIENTVAGGGVDISSGLISQLMIVESNISGSLDLSQTQMRCSYDIRKNNIGAIIAAEIGFGFRKTAYKPDNPSQSSFEFTQTAKRQAWNGAP